MTTGLSTMLRGDPNLLGGKSPVVCSWALGLTTFYPSALWASDLFLHAFDRNSNKPHLQDVGRCGESTRLARGLVHLLPALGGLGRSFLLTVFRWASTALRAG